MSRLQGLRRLRYLEGFQPRTGFAMRSVPWVEKARDSVSGAKPLAHLPQSSVSRLAHSIQDWYSAHPPPPSAGVSVTAIAAGSEHTCAVSSGGGLWCWGWNGFGELGIGSTAEQHSPVAVRPGAGVSRRCAADAALQMRVHSILWIDDGWIFGWMDGRMDECQPERTDC